MSIDDNGKALFGKVEISAFHAVGNAISFAVQPPFVLVHGVFKDGMESHLSELQSDSAFQREVSVAVKEVLVPLLKKKLASKLAKVE